MQSAAEIWTSIQSVWKIVYVGPPDHLTVEQSSSYVRKEIKSNLETDSVKLHEAAIENQGAIETVE